MTEKSPVQHESVGLH